MKGDIMLDWSLPIIVLESGFIKFERMLAAAGLFELW
jgi:hypothetical protein